MFDNWEANIVFRPGAISNAVYLRRKREPGIYEYLTGDNTIFTVKAHGVIDNKDDPYFALLDDDQLRALQTAISNHGVKPPEASYTQGKLEATQKHLEDMRSMLSLNIPRLAEPVIQTGSRRK